LEIQCGAIKLTIGFYGSVTQISLFKLVV